MTPIQKALVKAGVVSKEKVDQHNWKQYKKFKKKKYVEKIMKEK